MKKKKVAAILYEVFLKSCICDLDRGSSCVCTANIIANRELEKLYGRDWHDVVMGWRK